jgi:hypothetical protein
MDNIICHNVTTTTINCGIVGANFNSIFVSVIVSGLLCCLGVLCCAVLCCVGVYCGSLQEKQCEGVS